MMQVLASGIYQKSALAEGGWELIYISAHLRRDCGSASLPWSVFCSGHRGGDVCVQLSVCEENWVSFRLVGFSDHDPSLLPPPAKGNKWTTPCHFPSLRSNSPETHTIPSPTLDSKLKFNFTNQWWLSSDWRSLASWLRPSVSAVSKHQGHSCEHMRIYLH